MLYNHHSVDFSFSIDKISGHFVRLGNSIWNYCLRDLLVLKTLDSCISDFCTHRQITEKV